MPRLTWTPPALRDVARLHDFLAPKSRQAEAARRAARVIQQGVKALSKHPEIGRPVDDMPPEFREWFIPFGDSGYVVLYRDKGELVAILAVRHGKEATF